MVDDNPWTALKSQWLSKIEAAKKAKEDFKETADECQKYFEGPYLWLYGLSKSGGSSQPGMGNFVFTGNEELPKPSICMTFNKVAEGVQLFGPTLYHRNPNRTVNPRDLPILPIEAYGNPADPQVQAAYMMSSQMVAGQRSVDVARSTLLNFYLNYTPTPLDLKTEMQMAIDEAIITGAGVLWHEMYQSVGSQMRLSGSFYDTVDNLQIDPDVELLRDATWIARKCIHPVWQVELEYGLEPGTLKANVESKTRQAVVDERQADWERTTGKTADLLVYWKIWSKMGIGTLLSGTEWQDETKQLDRFGRYCHLVVCHDNPWPLNLPPETWGSEEEMAKRLQWETPFWADDAWPMTMLAFHKIRRKVWPMAHFKPALGELAFLNWAYSFVASKIKKACRDIIACKKAAAEEVERAIISGTDYELIKISQANGKINEIVEFLQHPPFQGDIWTVIEAVERNFERRVGLTELMYGIQDVQDRSATATSVKQSNMSIRIDHMVNKVEDFASELSRKEALAARWHHDGPDLVPLLGQVGAAQWQQFVASASPDEILHQLQYRVEAGSARKPNRDRDAANAANLVQSIGQPLFELAMSSGQVGPINAILEMVAKANDQDPAKFQVQPPPPAQGPSPEEVEMQQKMMEGQMKMVEGQQRLKQDEAEHKQEMRQDKEKHAQDLKLAKEQAKAKAAATKIAARSNGQK